jgi:hypothetical protein
LHRRAEDHASDAAETIDTHLDCHDSPSWLKKTDTETGDDACGTFHDVPAAPDGK